MKTETATTPTTAEVVAGMLKENTGAHFLDSGGVYGRNYERNQSRDFEKEPRATMDFSDYGNGFTISLYHWLNDRLTYAADIQADFDQFAALPDNDSDSWFEVLKKWCAERGHENREVINTANGDSNLSQVIQWWHFEDTGDRYEYQDFIILMVHGGCDYRGGYTAPKMFYPNEDQLLYGEAAGYIYCERTDFDPAQIEFNGKTTWKEPHNWFTDDGCHWYFDGSTGPNQLQDFERSDNPAEKGKGKIYRDPEGNGYCPLCGSKFIADIY